MTDDLLQPVTALDGVSAARAEVLQRLDIATIRDLLFHFPRTYEAYSGAVALQDLQAGVLQTVAGEVVEIDGKRLPDGRTVLQVVLSDGGDACLAGVWFNQTYAASLYRMGQRLAFTGKPKRYRDHWSMNVPKVEVLDADTQLAGAGVVPVYPLTEDLRVEQLRPLLRQAVERHAAAVPDILPGSLRSARKLLDMATALRSIHFPATLAEAELARQRFVYEEFLTLQVALAVRRRELRDRQRAPVLQCTHAIDRHIRRLFPFTLTNDQNRAIGEICADLASNRPMQRLLQADVGAGKTAVAVHAMLVTVAEQHQAVLMAPTEVLARQHWRTLDGYLAHSKVRRVLLTGALSPRNRRIALAEIAGGQADIIVGTQALVQDGVEFAKLGLVVIDEQHKFGVNQRARIKRLGVDPHYLIMTATPIPRTVSLTLFGDLDISIIKQLPPGRQPVNTRWEPEGRRLIVYRKLAEELRAGRQAYIVCPLVEESATLDLKAAEQTHAELQQGLLKEFRLGLLHGRLDEADKDAVMQQFRERRLDALVCTTVIEVGVDVPNATLLVVEHAERFGLSQLHQLRGRISRGAIAGQCYLFAQQATDEAKARLNILTQTTDGFRIAEEDAKLRGLGEFFGTRQHGFGELRHGDLYRDHRVLLQARKDAIQLVKDDAGLRAPAHALLRAEVVARYGKTLDLAEIG